MNQHDHISAADQALADQLDALGSAARQHGQLVERTISASSSLLPRTGALANCQGGHWLILGTNGRGRECSACARSLCSNAFGFRIRRNAARSNARF